MMNSVSGTLSPSRPTEGRPAIAVRRAALFLLVCSPLWLAPRVVWQGYPFTLPVLIGLTLVFLRWDGRHGAAIGLDLSWRRAGELLCGLAGAALLVAAIALRSPWYCRSPGFAIHDSIRRWRCFRSRR
jgi:hypothetical protein